MAENRNGGPESIRDVGESPAESINAVEATAIMSVESRLLPQERVRLCLFAFSPLFIEVCYGFLFFEGPCLTYSTFRSRFEVIAVLGSMCVCLGGGVVLWGFLI